MPGEVARNLAFDTTVTNEELEAIIGYLDRKLEEAGIMEEPIPFLDYRSRAIFQETLHIRREEEARRGES